MNATRTNCRTEWVVLLAGLLLLGGFLIQTLRSERREIEQNERERLVAQARILHDNVLCQLAATQRTLLNVRDELPEWRKFDAQEGASRANRRLKALTEAMPGVRTMLVLDRAGEAIASNRRELIGLNFADRDHFKATRSAHDTRTLHVSPPSRTLPDIWGMNLTHVVLDARGEFAGAVSATLDSEMFQSLLDSVLYAEDMRTALIHGEGLIFIASPHRERLAETSLAKPDGLFSRHVASGRQESLFVGAIAAGQGEWIAAFRNVQPAGLQMDHPPVVMAARSPQAIYAGWNQRVQSIAIGFALLALVSVTSLWLLQRRRRRDEARIYAARAERDRESAALEKLVALRTADLALAKESAEAANRAKTAFLANMSHELRTPLNGIVGAAALAQRRTADPKVRNYLGTIERCSLNLLGLISDVLDIARIEAEKLTFENRPFRLGEVIENVRSLTGHQATAKGLALRFDCTPELAERTVRGDPLRLTQILANLIGNAVKFTPTGEIRVRIEQRSDDAAPSESGAHRPSKLALRCEVQDSGIGIQAEDQERIFRPFEQADNSRTRAYGGSGLGLAISKQLVDLLGGRIGVESEPGQGSTFWFTVDLDLAGEVAMKPVSAGVPALERIRARHAGRYVLLAEDEPVNREVARELLEEAGLLVNIAANGEEAEALARLSEDFALVLMDMQMPVMDGLEATRLIREAPALADLPIIAMTANVYADDHQRCLAAGMNDFIAKPINPESFYATVLRWLDAHPPAAAKTR